jgi:hypothetical protein
MTNFTDQEIIALYMGIIRVNLSKPVVSASKKIEAELKARGIEIDHRKRPTEKYQRKKIYYYHFIKGTETIAIYY